MKKDPLTIARMITFIVTLLTTIPLFIKYVSDQPPQNMLITHLHVWFGLAFFVLAIISMIKQKNA
jgi:hypothetical protein